MKNYLTDTIPSHFIVRFFFVRSWQKDESIKSKKGYILLECLSSLDMYKE